MRWSACDGKLLNLTHPAIVKALPLTSRLGTAAKSFAPSKLAAPFRAPVVHAAPFVRVAVKPLPLASATVVPAPSSNFQ
jgi:hypothetical protein